MVPKMIALKIRSHLLFLCASTEKKNHLILIKGDNFSPCVQKTVPEYIYIFFLKSNRRNKRSSSEAASQKLDV